MDIPLKGHTIGARIGRNIRQGDHQLLPLSAMPRSSPPATPPAKQGLGIEDGAV
jgi:hypothetical protein